MNRGCLGKTKFRFHLDLKSEVAHSCDTENRKSGKIDNVKSSRERQVKAQRRPIVLCALVLLSCGTCREIAAGDVDLIFVNGNVYTANERQPHAQAIGVRKDRIVFVGSNDDAEKLRNDKTRFVDLAGKTVVPGLTDSHCHIFGIGEREMALNLEGTNTLED